MLGFFIRRGRMLRKRRRFAGIRLTIAFLCASLTAVSVAEWRQTQLREAERAASDFSIITVFPLGSDSSDVAFTKKQFEALYYVRAASVVSADSSWSRIVNAANGIKSATSGNPLPELAKISLRAVFFRREIIEEAIAEIKRISPECDVKYDAERTRAVEHRIANINMQNVAGKTFAVAVIILLIYFSLRAEHLRDPDERQALEAMGAGRMIIATPHIVFASISGIYGAALAILLRFGMGFIPPEALLAPSVSLQESSLLIASVFALFFILAVITSFGRKL